ncbi:MAG: hypothetical protein HKL90_09165, partial [Elusimicrobia bacterium]|nr:hypothetical protein [Elusimicrobiota bacterium]
MMTPRTNVFQKALLSVALLTPMARAGTVDSGSVLAGDSAAAAEQKWNTRLGLSAEQSARYFAACRSRDADLKRIRDLSRAALRKLQSQLTSGASENDLRETLRQFDRARNAAASRHAQFDAALVEFLAPSQRAKLLMWRSMGA